VFSFHSVECVRTLFLLFLTSPPGCSRHRSNWSSGVEARPV
jgi:hypothetical protein